MAMAARYASSAANKTLGQTCRWCSTAQKPREPTLEQKQVIGRGGIVALLVAGELSYTCSPPHSSLDDLAHHSQHLHLPTLGTWLFVDSRPLWRGK